jgi:ACS family hexuronate transporter-like MFS transporter
MWTARNRLILALLICGGVLNYADRQIIAVLKPMLQEDLHWSDMDYGRLTSVFQFASAIAFLGSGWLIDRIGWRRANPLAVGAWSLVAMAHAAARTVGQFTLARFALGATEALGTPTAIKTLAAVFNAEERSLALGVMNAANTLGAVITPLVIPLIAIKIGWARAFLLTGGLGLVWVAAWFAFSPGRDSNEQGEEALAQAHPPERVRWGEVLRDQRTWAIAGAKALSDQVWWLLLFWTPDLFHRLFHLSLRGFGAPLAVIYACAAAGALGVGWVTTRLLESGFGLDRTRKLMLLVCALLATPVWLTVYVGNYWIATAILGLTLAAHQGFSLNIFALATDISPPPRVATVISFGALAGNLAGMVILQAAGWVLTRGYGYLPLLGLASVSYLLGLAWVQWLLPRIVSAADGEPKPARAAT